MRAEYTFKDLARHMEDRDRSGRFYSLYIIVIFVGLAFAWANYAELDNVTRGTGKIVSALQNQIVQASEAGVIISKFVDEDDLVRSGDILFEIDPVDAAGELNQLEIRIASMEIKEARLRAELEAVEFKASKRLRNVAPIVSATEESIFFSRRTSLEGALYILEQKLKQRQEDLKNASNDINSRTKTIELLEQQIDIVKPLVSENLAAKTDLLELMKELQKEFGSLENSQSQSRKAHHGIAEIQKEILTKSETFRLKALEELNEVVATLEELKINLPRLIERKSRKTIRAPMDGIVKKVNYNTLGGFVGAGDVVLELVPTGDNLVLEGKIKSSDISSIKLGDEVVIRLEAFNSSKYGTLSGRVNSISPDAITDPNQAASSHYPIDVVIEKSIQIEGIDVELLPGMSATLDVLTGKRTVLDYVWQPIAQVQELALRD